ncbi:hypothetical protein GQ42DRAFT_177923 [Ramicandelaber brevisporus]|nr:hypothetical protein GQ42DRAFT_177923 [Ramicandelaber brevisporus]
MLWGLEGKVPKADHSQLRVYWLLPGRTYKIGRGDQNDICTLEPSVSRVHAEIVTAAPLTEPSSDAPQIVTTYFNGKIYQRPLSLNGRSADANGSESDDNDDDDDDSDDNAGDGASGSVAAKGQPMPKQFNKKYPASYNNEQLWKDAPKIRDLKATFHTFVDGVQLRPNDPNGTSLRPGMRIQLGLQGPIFKVIARRFRLCVSGLNMMNSNGQRTNAKGASLELAKMAGIAGMEVCNNWDSSCTHLVTSAVTGISRKVLQALVGCRSIVTEDWIKSVVDSANNNRNNGFEIRKRPAAHNIKYESSHSGSNSFEPHSSNNGSKNQSYGYRYLPGDSGVISDKGFVIPDVNLYMPPVTIPDVDESLIDLSPVTLRRKLFSKDAMLIFNVNRANDLAELAKSAGGVNIWTPEDLFPQTSVTAQKNRRSPTQLMTAILKGMAETPMSKKSTHVWMVRPHPDETPPYVEKIIKGIYARLGEITRLTGTIPTGMATDAEIGLCILFASREHLGKFNSRPAAASQLAHHTSIAQASATAAAAALIASQQPVHVKREPEESNDDTQSVNTPSQDIEVHAPPSVSTARAAPVGRKQRRVVRIEVDDESQSQAHHVTPISDEPLVLGPSSTTGQRNLINATERTSSLISHSSNPNSNASSIVLQPSDIANAGRQSSYGDIDAAFASQAPSMSSAALPPVRVKQEPQSPLARAPLPPPSAADANPQSGFVAPVISAVRTGGLRAARRQLAATTTTATTTAPSPLPSTAASESPAALHRAQLLHGPLHSPARSVISDMEPDSPRAAPAPALGSRRILTRLTRASASQVVNAETIDASDMMLMPGELPSPQQAQPTKSRATKSDDSKLVQATLRSFLLRPQNTDSQTAAASTSAATAARNTRAKTGAKRKRDDVFAEMDELFDSDNDEETGDGPALMPVSARGRAAKQQSGSTKSTKLKWDENADNLSFMAGMMPVASAPLVVHQPLPTVNNRSAPGEYNVKVFRKQALGVQAGQPAAKTEEDVQAKSASVQLVEHIVVLDGNVLDQIMNNDMERSRLFGRTTKIVRTSDNDDDDAVAAVAAQMDSGEEKNSSSSEAAAATAAAARNDYRIVAADEVDGVSRKRLRKEGDGDGDDADVEGGRIVNMADLFTLAERFAPQKRKIATAVSTRAKRTLKA